jgi:hypothetical protein
LSVTEHPHSTIDSTKIKRKKETDNTNVTIQNNTTGIDEPDIVKDQYQT